MMLRCLILGCGKFYKLEFKKTNKHFDKQLKKTTTNINEDKKNYVMVNNR